MKSLVHDIALDDVAIVIAGHEKDFEIRIGLAKTLDQHGAAHTRHHDINEEQVRATAEIFESFDRTLRAFGDGDFVAFFGQDRLEETKDVRLVVDYEDGTARGGQTVGLLAVQLENPDSNLAWKPGHGKCGTVIKDTSSAVSIRSCKGV